MGLGTLCKKIVGELLVVPTFIGIGVVKQK